MIEPQMPASAYKTYQILAPLQTHFRKGTCEEAECANHARGWKTVIDEAAELGQRQAYYIRRQSGRKFTEAKTEAGLTEFVFEAGQTCFTVHQIRLEREGMYFVRDGDHRGNPLGTRPRQHARPQDWVEDFAEHQQGLADRIERG